MQLSMFFYKSGRGWSVSQFPKLDSAQTMVLVFAAPKFMKDASALEQLRQAYPQSKLIGCSTAGEIAGAFVHDESLSVAVVRFAHTRLALAATEIAEADSRAAGERLVRQFDRQGLRAVFLLSEGLDVNGSELVSGVSAVLPPHVVVTGGLAGDGERFQGTWVLRDGRPQQASLVAIGFYGERLRVRHGSRGGWDGFGPERRVTHSRGNVLYELDGRPALALYKDYLGARAAELPAAALYFPLAIRPVAQDSQQLVRCISAVDEAEQSITFAGDIPNGYLAQLMHANVDRLVAGAGQAVDAAGASSVGAGPMLALAVSCVGRRIVLGERTDAELEATLKRLPANAQQIGFYAYGEIAPYGERACDLHNQTMTLTILEEI